MQKSTYLRIVLLCFVGVLNTTVVLAQSTDITKTKNICDINANTTIELGIDVMGEVLSKEGGEWDQIVSTSDATVIASNVSNIFNLVGKGPGTYTFRYTAINNACLPAGDTRTAVITILETAKDVSHTVYMCENESKTVDLSSVVSATLPNVAFSNPSEGSIAGDGKTLTIPATSSDQIIIGFTTDHGNEDVCENGASITLHVIRDGSTPQLTTDEITFCKETMKELLSLSNLSGVTVTSSTTNGTWLPAAGNTIPTTNGIADFSNASAGTYEFNYTWLASSCYAAGSTVLKIIIVDDLSSWPSTDPTDQICKTDNPNRIYDLMKEGLGIGIPVSAGVWEEVDIPDNASVSIDVNDGLFELAQAKSGIYKYKFTVNSAAEGICGLNGSNTITLTVGDTDGTVLDGRIQLCKGDVENAVGNLVLSDFISGLPASGVIWTAPGTASIIGTNNNEVSYADINTLGNGTHLFTFTYASVGCSGNGEGRLYLTVANGLNLSDNIELEYCRPDMPSEINLSQIVGSNLAGKGIWDKTNSASNDNDEATLHDSFVNLPTTGSGSKEFEFTFISSVTSGECAVQNIVIKIKVVDNF